MISSIKKPSDTVEFQVRLMRIHEGPGSGGIQNDVHVLIFPSFLLPLPDPVDDLMDFGPIVMFSVVMELK